MVTYFLVSRQMAARQAAQEAQEQARRQAANAALEKALRKAQDLAAQTGAQPHDARPSAGNRKSDGRQRQPQPPAIPGPQAAVPPSAATDAAGALLPAVPVPVTTTASNAWVRYEATLPGQGSQCRIAGTSSIHDWTMETPIVAGSFEVDARMDFAADASASAPIAGGAVPARAQVRIPVRTLKSYNAKMDEVYKQHIEESVYRNIEYHLERLAYPAGDRATNAPRTFDSTGNLIIHGVTNQIAMPVTIERLDDRKLQIRGSTGLKMTEYQVQPPAPQLPGLPEIRTGDEITVSFVWVVARP